MSQVRILIVGVGSIGERHLRCFQTTGRAVPSICEINSDLRTAVAERYGVEKVFISLEDALEGEHDAAVVSTPAHLHVPMATKLAEAGLQLLIEKPLSVGLDGISRLRKVVALKETTVAIGYNWRCHPALESMKEALDSGRFGRPLDIRVASGQHFPTYRPAYREIYYTDRATGGGAIQDGLTHMLNAGEWLAGPIDRLVCDAEHQALEGVTVEDTVHILARHGSVLGSYNCNQYQAPNETTITVVCEDGTVRLESQHTRWGWMTKPETPWQYESSGKLERDTFYIRQANAFLDTLEEKRRPPCSLEEGIQTLRVNLAALRSTESRQWEHTATQGESRDE